MTIINLYTRDQELFTAERPKVASGNQKSVVIRVNFDSAWDGYAKSAVFYTEKDSAAYEKVMSGNQCTVPQEVIAEPGALFIGVRGVDSEGTVKQSLLVRYKVERGSNGQMVYEPTPSLYQQLLNALGLANARIDNLLAGNGEPASEVVDMRVGANGKTYSTAGNAVRDQITSLDNTILQTVSVGAKECGYLTDANRIGLWEQGWVSSQTGETGESGTDYQRYIRYKGFVNPEIGLIKTDSDYRLAIYVYNQAGAFETRITGYLPEYSFDHANHKYRVAMTGAPTDGYNGASTPITPEEAIHAHAFKTRAEIATMDDIQRCVSMKAMEHGYFADYNSAGLWEQGYIYSTDGTPGYTGASIDYMGFLRTADFVPECVERILVDAGFDFSLYAYDIGGTYIERVGERLTDYTLDHSNRKYKIGLCRNNRNPIDRAEYKHIYFFGSGGLVTPYSRDVNFGQPPTGAYYRGLQTNYSKFGAGTKAVEVISAFDVIASENPGYCTKKQIGTDAKGNGIYSYTLSPTVFKGTKSKPIPKIIITAGVHGFEKSNVFGLYYFAKDLCGNWADNPLLEYLRHHVEFVIVPIVTPSAFDADTYKNGNGVNINRNFDDNWVLVDDADSSAYGGAEPFDQPESRAIRDLVLSNLDAFFFIDFHSMGSGCVSNFTDINWHAYSYTTDNYYIRLADACCFHIANITAHFNKDYSLNLGNGVTCGKYTGFIGTPGNGCCDNWVMAQGIPAMTFEGFNGFPGGGVHSANVQKANSELIGNWLLTIINEYK